MYNDLDFYELPEQEQRRLIHGKRVATSSGLLSEIPNGEPPVRVFEKSLEELILNRLETGWYTINELAEEFDVASDDVRRIINMYRRRGLNGFTGESFKYNLLEERDGVLRVQGIDGAEFQYSFETIPYFGRVVDPTLVISLLDVGEHLKSFPTLVEEIPAGKASQIDETYALVLGDFWELDPQAIFDEITKYDRTYVETTLLPFPVVDGSDGYGRVKSRFQQPDAVYERFRSLEQAVERISDEFLNLVERGQPGIRMYQAVSIELADLKRAIQLQSPSLRPTANDRILDVVSTLNPESEEVETMKEETEAPLQETSVDDEVLTVLDEDWKTPQEVYESLPSVTQSVTTPQEVRGALEHLARTGVISHRNHRASTEYNSKSGTVAEQDIY